MENGYYWHFPVDGGEPEVVQVDDDKVHVSDVFFDLVGGPSSPYSMGEIDPARLVGPLKAPPPPTPQGCKRKLASGQWWAYCGETDMGQSLPSLCTECGGKWKLAAVTC